MKAPAAANVDPTRRLEWVLRSSVIFLGLLQAWATRDAIDNDVLSYLDMGDALLRGDRDRCSASTERGLLSMGCCSVPRFESLASRRGTNTRLSME